MHELRTLRNYYFYCGLEKDEYNAIKKDAYVSNFEVWNILHYLMCAVFCALYITSFFSDMIALNRWYYLAALLYSLVAIVCFFLLKKDSIAAQFLIYLTMSVLFLYGALVNLNNPDWNATTFVAFLLIAPMFMIDKPYFMTLELSVASAVYLIWMHGVKPYDVWCIDLVNVLAFTFIGSFLNVIANSIRIREFALTREIRTQRDTDEMTGLRNKRSLTGEINAFLSDEESDRALLFILDVDRFKSINDVFGHDVGDDVIVQIGRYLGRRFCGDEIIGRFGGDEFIIFIKNTADLDTSRAIAAEVVKGVSESVTLPDPAQRVRISVGITAYHGLEKNYSEIFKKADLALYKAKADPVNRVYVYEESAEERSGDKT